MASRSYHSWIPGEVSTTAHQAKNTLFLYTVPFSLELLDPLVRLLRGLLPQHPRQGDNLHPAEEGGTLYVLRGELLQGGMR